MAVGAKRMMSKHGVPPLSRAWATLTLAKVRLHFAGVASAQLVTSTEPAGPAISTESATGTRDFTCSPMRPSQFPSAS